MVKNYIYRAVFYKAALEIIAAEHWFKVLYYFCFSFSHDGYLILNSIFVVIFSGSLYGIYLNLQFSYSIHGKFCSYWQIMIKVKKWVYSVV